MNNDYLFRIFRYTYNAIEKEYKECTAIKQDKFSEYRRLMEYINWLQSQADYKDFDNWCQKWVDNDYFTLGRLFYEFGAGLFCSYTYKDIKKIISDAYKAFHDGDLDRFSDWDYDILDSEMYMLSPAVENLRELVDVYITDDD